MALKVNYKDDVLNTTANDKRKFNLIQNDDGTVSLVDATDYSQVGDSFGAADINATNEFVNGLTESLVTANNNSNNHILNKTNPHNVTKEQIGLGNVNNTADSVKSVNYANSAGSAVDQTARNTANACSALLNSTSNQNSSIFMKRNDGTNNANYMFNTGIYGTDPSTANSASANYGMLVVFRLDNNNTPISSTSWIWQIWMSTADNSIYIRRNINYKISNWSAWERLH